MTIEILPTPDYALLHLARLENLLFSRVPFMSSPVVSNLVKCYSRKRDADRWEFDPEGWWWVKVTVCLDSGLWTRRASLKLTNCVSKAQTLNKI